METVDNSKKEIKKPYRLTRSEYMQWRNDQKAKKNIRALTALLFDKVKNWESREIVH